MKRYFIIFLLIFICFGTAFSYDNYNNSGNLTVNLGVSFLYPVWEDYSVEENIFASILTSSVSMGAGYHFNIIEGILAPGFYGDLHISLIDFLLSDLRDEDDEIIFPLQFGVRLYNQFRIGTIRIQPFAGFNFIWFASDSILNVSSIFGLSAVINNFGIEYALMPFTWDNEIKNVKHRLVFLYSLNI